MIPGDLIYYLYGRSHVPGQDYDPGMNHFLVVDIDDITGAAVILAPCESRTMKIPQSSLVFYGRLQAHDQEA